LAGKGAADGADARLSKRVACACLIGAVALIAAAVSLYLAFVPHDIDLVRLQWAGSSTAAMAVMHGHREGFRTGLWWDLWALIPGTAGLLLACYLGRRVFWTKRARFWARAGLAASAAVGALNAVQDWLLLIALGDGFRVSWLYAVAALSLATFSVLLVAVTVGALALATTLARLSFGHFTQTRWEKVLKHLHDKDLDDKQERPVAIPPPLIEVAGSKSRSAPLDDLLCRCWQESKAVPTCCERVRWMGAVEADHGRSALRPARVDADVCQCRWDRWSGGPDTHWAQGFASPTQWEPRRTGICVSGGGIRSASVALGALQALREEEVLSHADYLVSVSGGGYTTGALQLALTDRCGKAAQVDRVFAPGSPEEDYLRRHSSYIADGLGQWLVALAVLFRGVLSSLVVIGLTVTAVGLVIGGFYGYVPIVDGGNLAKLRPRFLVHNAPHPGFPRIPAGVWVAVGIFAALAVLVYLVQLSLMQQWSARARVFNWIVEALTGITALLAIVGVALPALLWVSSWVTWHLGVSTRAAAAAVGSLSVILTYLGAITATLWRNRTTLAKSAGTVTGVSKGPVSQVLPNSMIQMIIMWICLVVLILVGLLACGWAATSGLVDSWWALIPVGALAVIAARVDQTSFSLHPFYRRRLASAFAVRRAARRAGDVAEPYGEEEMTWLSDYAGCRDRFPDVTFNATANITGQDRTPPGRRAVPFMLAHDYIGGPQAGWVRTDFLHDLTERSPIRGDLTVEAAMAISGAAFASAMGSQTRFYEVFLAISNARLGAWLPNPHFVALKLQHLDDWTIPGLPRRRGLSYFAREIFNVHPSTGRLLLCTDGGHYDNLGLVEMLRRRCKRIYCIDASGAGPPLDDTLAGAIALAREELGVEITLTDAALDLVPGGRDLLKPPGSLADLNKRLSKSAVTIGKITYPEIPNHKETHGVLVFAQAILTPDMLYQLLDFPQDDVGFPRDSTADQWFNAAQFDAYQQLGRIIGQAAARAPAHLPATSLAYLSSQSSTAVQAVKDVIGAVPPHPLWRVRARRGSRSASVAMKIVVFGANGPTGRLLTVQALAAGHHVVAVTRHPASFPLMHERLSVAEADVRDAKAVGRLFEGAHRVVKEADVVLSALGEPFTREPVNVYSIGTRNIVTAMSQHRVKRLVVVSSSAAQPRDHADGGFLLNHVRQPLITATIGKATCDDMRCMEELVRGSKLEWTIMRPSGLFDAPGVTCYALHEDQAQGIFTSRADLAASMLAEAIDVRFVCKTVAVTTSDGVPTLFQVLRREVFKPGFRTSADDGGPPKTAGSPGPPPGPSTATTYKPRNT
jgi:putative NADH-flavin reductase